MTKGLCIHSLGDSLCRASPILVAEAQGICNKTIRDCVTKFDNVESFAGFRDTAANLDFVPADPYPHLPADHPDRFPITRYFRELYVDGSVVLHSVTLPPKVKMRGNEERSIRSLLTSMERRGRTLHYIEEIDEPDQVDESHESVPDFIEHVGWMSKNRKFLRETKRWKMENLAEASPL